MLQSSIRSDEAVEISDRFCPMFLVGSSFKKDGGSLHGLMFALSRLIERSDCLTRSIRSRTSNRIALDRKLRRLGNPDQEIQMGDVPLFLHPTPDTGCFAGYRVLENADPYFISCFPDWIVVNVAGDAVMELSAGDMSRLGRGTCSIVGPHIILGRWYRLFCILMCKSSHFVFSCLYDIEQQVQNVISCLPGVSFVYILRGHAKPSTVRGCFSDAVQLIRQQ